MLPPTSKTFNKALNKTILLLLERKFVSTDGNKKFVKKKFSLGRNCFSLSGITNKWKKRFFTSQKKSFYLKQWSFSVKIGFRILSIMVTTSKKNTVTLKNTISHRQKRILKLLLKLAQIIIEVRKNRIF